MSSTSCNWDLFNKLSGSGCSGSTDGDDHISNLPECVLSRILSCLPTVDAVRTCVLSKVWEYKWTSIYNIDVYDHMLISSQRNDDEWKEDDEACFVKFMDRILLNSQNIKSFDLRCAESYDGSLVETWLSALFRHNVEFVYLDICGTIGALFLPRSLLYCTALRELDMLLAGASWKVPAKICFHNLTSLHLGFIKILNDNPSTDTLTFTLPVLATLELTRCTWLKVKLVEFDAPCLSSLRSDPMDDDDDVPLDDYRIKISGAELDKITCYGFDLENFLLTGSSVQCAYLYVDGLEDDFTKIGLRTRKLLTELSSIKELTLSCYMAQVIAQTKAGHHLHIPKLDKLGKLKLSGDGTYLINKHIDIEALFELLHAAPSLNDLFMYMGHVRFMESEDGYDYRSVPSCIVSHLKTVEFKNIENKAHQLRLAMYVLEHGAKLKTFSFSDCRMDEVELGNRTSEFPKASTCVRIVID